jgi:Cu(I)/Ag(I) efflux system periplasmic protein CusF
MKAAVLAAALLGCAALVHASEMRGADTRHTDHADHKSTSKDHHAERTHRTTGVVKKLDPTAGTVLFAHEPVKTLNWPAMTMTFRAKNKAVLDKLAVGKKVEVEFEERSKQYVITSVKQTKP